MRPPYAQRLRGYDVFEGGHAIRRLLPAPTLPMVGPFVLFDAFGPATLAVGQGVDIAAHRHAHLATVTHFFAGSTHHTDSLGHDVIVEAGDVAWMHAGAGIVHTERTPDALRARGGSGHGVQAWVALPEDMERSAPRFELVRARDVPTLVRGGLEVRVLVGELLGARAPIQTCSPVLLAALRADTSAGETTLELGPGRHALYVAEGLGALDGHRVGVGTLLLLAEGAAPLVRLEVGLDRARARR
jgi:redox-sensitive bicupin YhaK (pirin superfamily)